MCCRSSKHMVNQNSMLKADDVRQQLEVRVGGE